MITGLYAGILGFFLIGLIFRVIVRRFQYKVGIGDGGIQDLSQAIRVHGNFVEMVPIILFIMLVMELGEIQGWFLHLFGMTLVVSRFFHAAGLTKTPMASFGRQAGILLSLILLGVGSSILVFMYIK